MVTLKLVEAELPAGSVAVQMTVVTPIGNADPGGGMHSTVVPGAPSAFGRG
jgi:hypothetical protein